MTFFFTLSLDFDIFISKIILEEVSVIKMIQLH